MLKLQYLFENYDLAKKCLEIYDCDLKSIDEMLKCFRISSNAVYPFRKESDSEKICFLRLSPAVEKDFSEVEAEIHLIQWLIDQGYPAMKPVKSKNGLYASQLQTGWGVYNVSCFEKIEGDTLEDVDGTPALVQGYGYLLGSFHKLMKHYPYSRERDDHKKLLEIIGERLAGFNAPAIVLEEYEAVCQELSELRIDSDSYGLVHYDFEPDNVLYDKNTNLFGVIDFDDAIRCWYSLDVVRAIDAMDDVVEEAYLEDAVTWFLHGYRTACPFSDEQMSELPLMRRLVHLQEYATLLYVMSEPVESQPQWMEQLIGKLENKLLVLENSMVG